MERPKIEIQKEPVDYILEILGIIGLAALIIAPLLFYSELPDKIPMHYNATGEPDGFGGKFILWLLPLVGLFLYLGLTWLNRFPHVFNYPIQISEENAERQYKNSVRMIKTLNALITLSFAYMTWATINTAMGKMDGLGGLFLPIFLTITSGSLAYFIIKSIKSK